MLTLRIVQRIKKNAKITVKQIYPRGIQMMKKLSKSVWEPARIKTGQWRGVVKIIYFKFVLHKKTNHRF